MSGHPREHGTVVVGVDGSESGYAGVRYAAREAQRLDVALAIVHVLPTYLPQGPILMVPDGSLQAYGAGVLERAAEVAHEVDPRIEVDTYLRTGPRVEQLVTQADGAALLVLGSRHLSVMDRLWTGATVAGAVARASCPVVVVPGGWEPATPHGRVVAGYKSARHADELLAASFALAAELGAELEVLHAWKLPGLYDDLIAGHAEEEDVAASEVELIEPLLADFRLAYPGVVARVRVTHERPARALVEATGRADRLVIVKPAHGALVHHLGTAARVVLRDAECPVEVLPAAVAAEDLTGLVLERGGELVP